MTFKILALGTYSVNTTDGGGKYVINNLFRRLPSTFHTDYYSLVESDKKSTCIDISSNFYNFHIPQNIEQAKIQWKEEKSTQVGLFDVIQINNWSSNVEFVEQIKKNIEQYDLIILEHPYLANLLHNLDIKKPIIYHAHNVEYIQKKSLLKGKLLEDVKNIENLACEISTQIWVSSNDEKKSFISLYNIDENKIKLLPHGVDLNSTEFIEKEKRLELKSDIDELKNKTIFVFTGSWHPPNLEALEFIIDELSNTNQNFLFYVIGSVKDNFIHEYPDKKIPENVVLFGVVSDAEKIKIYSLSDYAINPMFSGAGTNLKMLEYVAMGLPVITTNFGARGLTLSEDSLIAEKNEWKKILLNINTNDFKKSIISNFNIIKNKYDYDVISQKSTTFLYEILDNDLYNLNQVFVNIISELNNMSINSNDPLIDVISKESEPFL